MNPILKDIYLHLIDQCGNVKRWMGAMGQQNTQQLLEAYWKSIGAKL